MADYHVAFSAELRLMFFELPVRRGQTVLDVGSGDGTYARWLAEKVGQGGRVLAIDHSTAFLEFAARESLESPDADRIIYLRADIRRLPLPRATVDLAWCAQSLYSLPDPIEALRIMATIVRPGGRLVVFENDEFHHVILPWPVEIELALRKAELLSFIETSERPRKYYIGRDLLRVFHDAGISHCRIRSFAFDRQAPLDNASRAFLVRHLEEMRQRVAPHLEPSARELFDRLVEPGSGIYLLDHPDLSVTLLNYLAVATVQ